MRLEKTVLTICLADLFVSSRFSYPTASAATTVCFSMFIYVSRCSSYPTATTACCFMCLQPYYISCNNRLLLHVSPTLLHQLQQPLVASCASNPTTTAACCFSIQPYCSHWLFQHPTLLHQLQKPLVASCPSNPTITAACCFSASNPTTTACCFSIQPYYNSSSLRLTL